MLLPEEKNMEKKKQKIIDSAKTLAYLFVIMAVVYGIFSLAALSVAKMKTDNKIYDTQTKEITDK